MTLREARLCAVLAEEAVVREAAVVDRGGELVAFVVVKQEPPGRDRTAVREKIWETIFDNASGGDAPGDDPTLHFGSWTNSFTGERFAEEEMRRAVDGTVARIAGLGGKRVLEIGCSTGLLLFRLAPSCERYVGVDLAAAPLAFVKRKLDGMPSLASKVVLHQGGALDLDWLAGETFDVVVMDSVVQYFPSTSYLRDVVAGVAPRLAPGGKIFLGDVRSLPLLEEFHTRVAALRASEGDTREELEARVTRGLAREKELVLDPSFVRPLQREVPAIAEARVQVKRGRDRNELALFRYDAVLTMNAPRSALPIFSWRSFRDEGMTWGGLQAEVDAIATSTGCLAVRDIPNARLAGEGAIEPEALFRLGEDRGLAVDVGWSGGDAAGDLAVVFGPGADAFSGVARSRPHAEWLPLDSFGTMTVRDRELERALATIERVTREAVEQGFPARVVRLDALPRDSRGEIDRRVLEEMS